MNIKESKTTSTVKFHDFGIILYGTLERRIKDKDHSLRVNVKGSIFLVPERFVLDIKESCDETED